MKTILLLGCSGTGKTSVGRALVELLQENSAVKGSQVTEFAELAELAEFVELEELFAKQTGQSFGTALELWESEKLQLVIRQTALDLLKSPEQASVISLTPSAPKDPQIAAVIEETRSKLLVVELRAALDVLGRRVGLNAPRPLGLVNSTLPGPYALFRQFNEDLHQVYQQFSPLVVDTSATTATQAAAQILAATR